MSAKVLADRSYCEVCEAPIPGMLTFDTGEATADVRSLWAAVHHYLVAQGAAGPPDVAELTAAYAQLAAEHNRIYDRYVAPDETAATAANTLAGT